MKYLIIIAILFSVSCTTPRLQLPTNAVSKTGVAFYEEAMAMQWQERDSLAKQWVMEGNMPNFLLKLLPVYTSVVDSNTNKIIKATYYVTPDYLSVGTNDNWARVPLTAIAAQIIADSLQCFLPTRKMVNDIYAAAKIKLAPVPMYIYRDSSVTMWQHHLIIEGQRNGRKGLIAGIKKDVVISDVLIRSTKANRVAIYGWHQLNGKPIQPLYAGHVNWYTDYSHGVRLVYRKIKVADKWLDYTTVMGDPILKNLLSDEVFADVVRY